MQRADVWAIVRELQCYYCCRCYRRSRRIHRRKLCWQQKQRMQQRRILYYLSWSELSSYRWLEWQVWSACIVRTDLLHPLDRVYHLAFNLTTIQHITALALVRVQSNNRTAYQSYPPPAADAEDARISCGPEGVNDTLLPPPRPGVPAPRPPPPRPPPAGLAAAAAAAVSSF